jgi:integrase/recombinase XerD
LKRWPPEPAATGAGELLCREVCDQYQTWLREERGLATASVDALMWEARNFCAWFVKHSNATGFADLTVRDVDIYMDIRARGLTRKSLKDVAERLRSLLRHLHRTGRVAADLSQHVIAPLLYAYEGIPSALSSDQISTFKLAEYVEAAAQTDRMQSALSDTFSSMIALIRFAVAASMAYSATSRYRAMSKVLHC